EFANNILPTPDSRLPTLYFLDRSSKANSGSIQPIDNSEKSLVLLPVRGVAKLWPDRTAELKSSQ
ncbi:MAG TPA: hypothetical protein V6D48_24190, partial [Oculatellaceae cyanobacterium]